MCFIDEKGFAAHFAAADFAAHLGLWLDTTVTISWRLMGIATEEAMLVGFNKFLSCIRNWMQERKIPVAYIYVHEHGTRIGLHTHVAVSIPNRPASRPLRAEFRKWARDWATRQAGKRIGRVLRVRGPSTATPWLHWLAFAYQMKGYDRNAVVCSGRDGTGRRQVYLGDLVAFRWRDPGTINIPRCGHARGLGSRWRAEGHHPDGNVHRDALVDPFCDTERATRAFQNAPPSPFRSRYEDGARDVWTLYGDDFCERVLKMKNPRISIPDECGIPLAIDEVLLSLGI